MLDRARVDDKKKQLEIELRTIVVDISDQDTLINDSVEYALFPGGKRLRSLLTVLMYEMLGGTKGNIYMCACTAEMIHEATLMLDDLACMDDSSYRRGKLSCHKKFGEAPTILTAFGLAAESFRILSDKNNLSGIESDQSLSMIKEIAEKIGFHGLIGGQIADLNAGATLSEHVSDEQKLNYITRNKTAALFEVCALIACCLAEASKEDKKRLVAYAHTVGLALQIVDDLQDSDEDKGLSFANLYGVEKAKELVRQALKTADECITYENEYAVLLKQLPQLLLEGV